MSWCSGAGSVIGVIRRRVRHAKLASGYFAPANPCETAPACPIIAVGQAEAVTAHFLSYARADSAVALRFAEGLKAAGVALWVDQNDIRPSEHWDRAIEAALRNADGVIVILSPRSAASANVADEVSVALDAGKTVIPILIEPTTAPLRMTRLQFIDATRDMADALRRCVAVLGGEPAPPDPPPTIQIPEAVMSRIKAALTVHLGPIAGRLVEREARYAGSPAALIERLAEQIPTERDRAAFLKAAAK